MPLFYPVLAHAAIVTGSVMLRFVALAVLALNLCRPWRIRRAPAWIAATVLIGSAALTVHTAGAQAFFYATPVLVCLAVAWLFARTLRRGRTPLITGLARAIRGPLPPPVVRYTFAVTVFWSVVMLGMAVGDLLLALLAPIEWWSLFANLLNYLILAALFAAEWGVRRCVIREYEHTGWQNKKSFSDIAAVVSWFDRNRLQEIMRGSTVAEREHAFGKKTGRR